MVKSQDMAVVRCRRAVAAALVLVGIMASAKGADPPAKSMAYVEKVIGTPRFYQSDPQGEFPGQGQNYCSPTAVSDSLIYLAAHGFPKLLSPGIADPVEGQIAMIKGLASPECMKTDPASGTGPGQTLAGIQRYVERSGYVCRTIEHRGWRSMPGPAPSKATLPTLDWIKKAVADPHGAVWVNIGWYVAGATADEWKRVGGHWVAVVGYGVDGSGNENPDILLIDNPAVAADASAVNKAPAHRQAADGAEVPTNDEIAAQAMTVEAVKQGRLVGSEAGLPREAAGMYRVSGPGVAMPKKYDAAFLDGAIVLVIGER